VYRILITDHGYVRRRRWQRDR